MKKVMAITALAMIMGSSVPARAVALPPEGCARDGSCPPEIYCVWTPIWDFCVTL